MVGVIGLLAFPLYASVAWNVPASTYGSGYPQNRGQIGQTSSTGGSQISFDEAVAAFQNYVTATGNKDLAVSEVMEFQNNFYAIVYEKSTGMGAFELLIDKTGNNGYGGMMHERGLVFPEPGPNMMWNTKYGMMGTGAMMGFGRRVIPSNAGASASMPITAEQAKGYAMRYLDKNLPGASLEDPVRFYGYYTIHILKDGKIYGMLSVNGYTGEVWYHTWHGQFVQEKDLS